MTNVSHVAALEFHHTNPNEKEVDPSKMYYESWEKAQIEIDKCDLLCSNCHMEIHADLRLDEPDSTPLDNRPIRPYNTDSSKETK